MYEIYTLKNQNIYECDDSDFEQVEEFYGLFRQGDIWTNKRGDVYAWTKTNL